MPNKLYLEEIIQVIDLQQDFGTMGIGEDRVIVSKGRLQMIKNYDQ